MKYLEVIISANSFDTVQKIAENVEAEDLRYEPENEDGMQLFRMLVSDDELQKALDSFSKIIGSQPTAKVVVLPVEACLPLPEEDEQEKENKATAARESIYEEVEKNAHININFIVLVTLSTIVAAIGLIENNVAVVIGAMVIAPLLGPNIALSFATALGDIKLMIASVKTTILGISIAIFLSYVIALILPMSLESHEVLMRTNVGVDSVILALASGAAAALSITTGLSGVLVGVMVAVALLPPAAVLGLMLGDQRFDLAFNAGMLLAINIVSINLSSKIVFVLKGVTPRTWFEKEKAKHAMMWYISVWIITLIVLMLLIYL
ncbi:MAG TPA: TIGR00341 family protein [Sulfurovum sp.]|uniref:TIGR00341 family protein n=1 Tax=Sulfurovum sp. TaxID=1969726 RepID=UPI002F9266E1